MLGIVAVSCALLGTCYVPSYQGVDENGYIITARLMATQHGNPAKCVGDPYEFVSGNMVENREGIYYAKYPIGYPALCAVAYRIGGPSATFLVNPILAVLALVGMFFLGRTVLGRSSLNNLGGVLAALLLATNPLHNYFALSSLSHTGAICFAVWGMFFTWRWVQAGGWLNGVLGAALSAYGLTIRYTEALLVIPAAAMVLWRFVEIWRTTPAESRRRALLQTGGQVLLMLAAAVLAVAPLFIHHWVAYGSPWINGYSLCEESTGFAWKWFVKNWRLVLTRLDSPGLFLIFPLGLAGLIYLAAHDVKRALFLGLWILPTLLLYAAYYWAPEGPGWSYVRFFTSIFPPLILSALALLQFPIPARPAWTVAMAVFILLVSAVNVTDTFEQLERQNERLRFSAAINRLIQNKLPPDAVIFSEDHLLNFIEYAGDYRLYAFDIFEKGAIDRRLKVLENNEPHPFQRQKAKRIADLFRKKNNAQLAELQRKVVERHLARGRTVAVIVSERNVSNWRGRMSGQFQFVSNGDYLDVQVSPKGDRRPTIWSLYSLQRRDLATETNQTAMVKLTERIDQMQFRVQTMRAEHESKYPGAQQNMVRIMDTERELRDLREQQRRLAARKGGPVPPVRPPGTAPVSLAGAAPARPAGPAIATGPTNAVTPAVAATGAPSVPAASNSVVVAVAVPPLGAPPPVPAIGPAPTNTPPSSTPIVLAEPSPPVPSTSSPIPGLGAMVTNQAPAIPNVTVPEALADGPASSLGPTNAVPVKP